MRDYSIWKLLCLALPVIIFLSACSLYKPLFDTLELSKQEVSKFHALYNNEQYRDIYLSSHKVMKDSVTEEGFLEAMSLFKSKLGRVVSTERKWYNATGFESSGIQVTVKYKTTFERGEGEEEFVWEVKNGIFKLASYKISADALNEK